MKNKGVTLIDGVEQDENNLCPYCGKSFISTLNGIQILENIRIVNGVISHNSCKRKSAIDKIIKRIGRAFKALSNR